MTEKSTSNEFGEKSVELDEHNKADKALINTQKCGCNTILPDPSHDAAFSENAAKNDISDVKNLSPDEVQALINELDESNKVLAV